MPSQQYYLEVANKEIASLNEGTSTATALFMGDTEVLLKDRRILIVTAAGFSLIVEI